LIADDPKAIRGRRFLIEGRVQGVNFRAYTEREARALGLQGWVRNMPDGPVEIVARGERQALQALERWLWLGSPTANVRAVTTRSWLEPVGAGFEVRWD